MLQWVPSRDGLVIYNDREAEGYVARVQEVADTLREVIVAQE